MPWTQFKIGPNVTDCATAPSVGETSTQFGIHMRVVVAATDLHSSMTGPRELAGNHAETISCTYRNALLPVLRPSSQAAPKLIMSSTIIPPCGSSWPMDRSLRPSSSVRTFVGTIQLPHAHLQANPRLNKRLQIMRFAPAALQL